MKDSLMALLQQYDQQGVYKFYNRLDSDGKARLEKQLEDLDWGLLDLDIDKPMVRGRISPIQARSIEDIRQYRERYSQIGLETIRQGKVAAILLAGGQGTRLGCDGPKGMVDIGQTRHVHIFECLFVNTLKVVKEAGCWIPFFIMTSEKNNDQTIDFLKRHHFFGYNPEYVYFFTQEMAPTINHRKHLLFEAYDRLATSPNGNGGWFSSLEKAGLVQTMKDMGIEWLNAFAVDNVLQQICDPCFLGAVIEGGYVSGAKCVAKADPREKVGVMCLEDGRPSIIEYYEITDEMADAKNEKGEYIYTYGVILNYLFRLDMLESILKNRMPVHMVDKKVPFMDEDGITYTPDKPNGYKFETLIIDMVNMMDNCLAYEVERDKEFAPIKNLHGIDSVDSARSLMKKNGYDL